MAKFLFKFPTRSRPELFKKNLENYFNNLSYKHEYKFLISMDHDDSTMNNDEMVSWLKNQNNVVYNYGNSKNKVQAINSDINLVKDFDILFLISDDMVPQINGFDDIVANAMNDYGPSLDYALHFNDGRTGDKLNTLSIMGSKMYYNFGYIYHPDYISLWCDNEFHDVTKRDGKVTYLNKVIVKHSWTDYTGKDDLHKRNEKYYDQDKRTYMIRKSRKFPKKSIFK